MGHCLYEGRVEILQLVEFPAEENWLHVVQRVICKLWEFLMLLRIKHIFLISILYPVYLSLSVFFLSSSYLLVLVFSVGKKTMQSAL